MPNLSSVCDQLRAPNGEQLLELLASVYGGVQDEKLLIDEFGKDTLETATNLALLKPCGQGQVLLSSVGYLVGNVAKEYIHWVDNGRKMPPPCPPDDLVTGKNVLDLGCSFGRWLWRFQKDAGKAIGLEMQGEYIELGKVLAQREGIPCPEMYQGSAEELSRFVASGSIDFVFTRLVLNHVYIRKTLLQIADVLSEDGVLWVQIEPWSTPFRHLLQRNRGRQLRKMCFDTFSVVNSLVFATTNHQMAIRVQGRMHSVHKPVFPTLRTWKSIVLQSGLRDFRVIQNNVFCARKS